MGRVIFLSESYSTGAPYKLAGSRLVFTSWYYVESEKGVDWCDDDGNTIKIRSAFDPMDARVKWKAKFPNYGIRIKLNKAQRTGPIFKNDKPWDRRGMAATILKDGGMYRAWGATAWHYNKSEGNNFLCYLESSDGYEWKKPNCGIYEYAGNKNNNILSDRVWQFHPGGVFIDPLAPAKERYKWLNEENFTAKEVAGYLGKYPDDVDSKALDKITKRGIENSDGRYIGARGAISEDGIHWEFIESPLVITHTDTHPTCYYDTQLKKYVAYFRDFATGPQAVTEILPKRWGGWTRSVGRSESDSFLHFPLPDVVLVPDMSHNPNEVLYTNCRTTIPGAPDHHLMFPSVWDTGADCTHVIAASSYDGKYWQNMPGGSVLDTAEYGQWDGGYVFAYPDLIELPNGDFALPYTGLDVPHKYPRDLCTRNVGYALWPKGRLAGIASDEIGEFTTVAIIPSGNKIFINAITKRAGYIKIEACDINGNPLHGRSFEDSVQIFGDCYKKQVLWKEYDNIGVAAGQPVVLRFKMNRAEIYGLDFE